MSLESTAALLRDARQGNRRAREQLMRAYLPIVKRLAHGRLPPYARGLSETDDLVQETLRKALDHLGTFEPRHEGAFVAYLRQILINQVRDEIRRARARPVGEVLEEEVPSPTLSPLEEVAGRETIERYDAALATLPPEHRELIILRLEMELPFQRVAEATEAPSEDAARMAYGRALAKLAEAMRTSQGECR